MSQSIGIPSVDLNDFLSGDPQRKDAFVQALGKAYEDIGFVALKNHRLSDELSAALYREVKAFFNLPTDIKAQYEIEGIAGQRGYTGFGKEHAKGRNTGDLKEFWHFGQYVEDGDAIAKEYPENIEVAELPDFNRIGKEAYQTLEATGRDMLRALALYLGLEETYFDAHIHNGNSILRPIHYPPITEEPQDAVRAAEHEDINLITLLMGASADGLQVLNKAGEWIPVTALPGQIVVNVGDMLQRHSNNKLRSTTHRVVNPPREKWAESRFSIPFFLHPRSEMPLDCLPECIDAEHPKQYEDISAGGYLDERLREIGLKS
ncbi:isopenicillin N synthase family dioxygenase [Croceimicrobium hydrocarbonivorans]|uniref:Isopenicillin N synthase family oxygenase n=1 Tax=Croceimicrobium hydrocarbonivorans TaxID=2761580 RepID=A0A7H0VCZ6_9FLAO|nr:isopenicillin N synthase family oxygenase [Croceimicrobium hydrocarbonivorans]QNR23594.1 isopenicillin N synthase family oxygenase [Croceimicrobium hydrocarbonivorans]